MHKDEFKELKKAIEDFKEAFWLYMGPICYPICEFLANIIKWHKKTRLR